MYTRFQDFNSDSKDFIKTSRISMISNVLKRFQRLHQDFHSEFEDKNLKDLKDFRDFRKIQEFSKYVKDISQN